MKKYLLLLLSVAILASCKKQIIDPGPYPTPATIKVTSTAVMGTATASIGGSLTHSIAGFTIQFSVTAGNVPAYLPSAAMPASSASAAHAIQYSVDNAAGANQAVGTGVITYAGTDVMTTTANHNYVIPAGQTKDFVLQITYQATGPGSCRASLENVNWSTVDFSDSSQANMFISGLNTQQFKTNYVTTQ